MRSDYRSPSLSSALTLLLAASVLFHCEVAEKSAPAPNPGSQGGNAGRSAATAEGGDEARAGEAGANGGAFGPGGSSGAPAAQGGTMPQSGTGGSSGATLGDEGGSYVGGQGGSDAGAGGAAGEPAEPVSGGRTSSNGGQNNASGGGGQTSASGGRTNTGGVATTAECSLNVHCSNPSRPFCSPQGRCVQCLSESQCPAASAECLKPACSSFSCTEVPQTANTACGDRASTTCSAPDSCDGRGNCVPNHVAPNTACDDGLYCNGADRCSAAGVCEHAGSPCTTPLVCDATTKACRCVNAGRSVADYCYNDPSQIEGLDRPATKTAETACGPCGGYNRVSSGNCVDFVCKG